MRQSGRQSVHRSFLRGCGCGLIFQIRHYQIEAGDDLDPSRPLLRERVPAVSHQKAVLSPPDGAWAVGRGTLWIDYGSKAVFYDFMNQRLVVQIHSPSIKVAEVVDIRKLSGCDFVHDNREAVEVTPPIVPCLPRCVQDLWRYPLPRRQ